jgi:hypothetical protein
MIKTVWHRKEVVKCVLFVLVVDVIWGFAVASVIDDEGLGTLFGVFGGCMSMVIALCIWDIYHFEWRHRENKNI